MLNRKAIASIIAVGVAAILVAQTGVFRYEARMSNGVAGGKAKYKFSNRSGRQIQEEIEFEGEDLAPNTMYSLTMAGSQVGEATTDGLGTFAFETRNVGARRWNFGTGTPVTVENANGIALSGTLQPR
jgi:hypothetical protein